MPRKYVSTASLPTPELNAVLRRQYVRFNDGPRNPDLCKLSLRALDRRLRYSTRSQERRLSRLIESVGEVEKQVEDEGGTVQQELEKPGNGRFRLVLKALASQPLDANVPHHDPGLLRFQYDCLWSYVRRHPLPVAPARRNKTLRTKERREGVERWLNAYWKACGVFLVEYPCLCQCNRTEPNYSTLYSYDKINKDYTTPSDLFHRLLAHLHSSTPSAIAQALKRSRRTARERRM
jgi:hypothetical protein